MYFGGRHQPKLRQYLHDMVSWLELENQALSLAKLTDAFLRYHSIARERRVPRVILPRPKEPEGRTPLLSLLYPAIAALHLR